MEHITLARGTKIPVVGLGTWKLTGPECTQTVKKALKLGYTHLDTAEVYGNQREIGDALRNREELFITSKVWRDHLLHDEVIAACVETLEELGTDYLDLYLIHWPNKEIPLKETLEAMKELQDSGKIKEVGVSNFTIKHLEEALPIAQELGIKIAVNQVEYHPGLDQHELLEYCKEHGIVIEAYSPLSHGKEMEGLSKIAKAHGRSEAQIALRWLLEKGMVVIPKSSSEEHLKENLKVFDFELTDDEIGIIDALGSDRREIDPPFAEF